MLVMTIISLITIMTTTKSTTIQNIRTGDLYGNLGSSCGTFVTFV